MSDFTVPSYRIRPARSGFEMPWRMVGLAAGAVAVLATCGGAAWYLMKRGSGPVPVIEADARPVRIRPDDPGGLRVANQDERIFDRRGTAPAAGNAAPGQRLAPDAERPDVNGLRQAAQTAGQTAGSNRPQPAARAAQPAPGPQPAPQAGPQTGSQPGPGPAAPVVSGPPAGSLVPLPSATAPAPAAAPAPPPVQARPTNPRIFIQLGALGSEQAARTEWDRLKRAAPELADRQPSFPRVDRGADQAPLWRIRTTGFPDANEARAFCEGIRGKGAPCTVIGG